MGNRYMIRNIQTSCYPSVPRMACTHTAYLVCSRQATLPWGVLPTIPAISHSMCYSLSKYNFSKPCDFYKSQLKKWCMYFQLLLTFTRLPDGLPPLPEQKKNCRASALIDMVMLTTRDACLATTERYSGYSYAFLEERSWP